jgi:hypothetical protein
MVLLVLLLSLLEPRETRTELLLTLDPVFRSDESRAGIVFGLSMG